jgi:DNA-binding MarR family transcriptional regulator
MQSGKKRGLEVECFCSPNLSERDFEVVEGLQNQALVIGSEVIKTPVLEALGRAKVNLRVCGAKSPSNNCTTHPGLLPRFADSRSQSSPQIHPSEYDRVTMENRLLKDVIRLAEFRGALRHFLRESERIARRHGLTPQRYLLLLMIKGVSDGSECSTVTELSTSMQLGQSSVSELVNRAVQAGLVRRSLSAEDRRVAQVRLTAEGERRLTSSFSDLQSERGALLAAVARLGPPRRSRQD